jgi:hypothetical protein
MLNVNSAIEGRSIANAGEGISPGPAVLRLLLAPDPHNGVASYPRAALHGGPRVSRAMLTVAKMNARASTASGLFSFFMGSLYFCRVGCVVCLLP